MSGTAPIALCLQAVATRCRAQRNARAEVMFIGDMVKCRPPNNRDAAPAALASCTKYLDRQIELVNPKLIVTLGRFAFGRYFPGEGITKASGKLRVKDGRKIFPVLHPAAVLRVAELRPTMIEDFKTIAEILEHATEAVSVEPDGNADEAPMQHNCPLSIVQTPHPFLRRRPIYPPSTQKKNPGLSN